MDNFSPVKLGVLSPSAFLLRLTITATAVDKDSKYLANCFPYAGKDNSRHADCRLADQVVLKLMQPFLKKGEMLL